MDNECVERGGGRDSCTDGMTPAPKYAHGPETGTPNVFLPVVARNGIAKRANCQTYLPTGPNGGFEMQLLKTMTVTNGDFLLQ